MADDPTSQPERHFEGYEDARPIGRGGMATVWKARQICLDRWVAIKVLAPDHCTDDGDIDRFQSEARTAARLNHPGIVPVYDAFYRNDRFCLVLAYVDGYTVGAWLNTRGYLSQEECLFVAGGVAEALAYAWNHQQLVHCDIKPENIMIDNDGSVKITDFGLSRSLASMQTNTETGEFVFGTPAYIPPEQAQAKETLTIQSDMYALGASLYHMCTGTRLFAGQSPDRVMEAQVNSQDLDPFDRNTALSPFFCDFLERLLCKNPADRFGSWEAVIEAIDRARKDLPFSASAIDPTLTPSTVRRSALRDAARDARLKELGPHVPPPAFVPPPVIPTEKKNASASPASTPATRQKTAAHQIIRFPSRRKTLAFAGLAALLMLVILVTNCTQAANRRRLAHAARIELSEIDAHLCTHPDDYATAINRCNGLVRMLKAREHAPIRQEAREKLHAMEAERKAAIERVMRSLGEEIAPLIEQQKFIQAAIIVSGYNGPMAGATRRDRKNLADFLSEKAMAGSRSRSQSHANE